MIKEQLKTINHQSKNSYQPIQILNCSHSISKILCFEVGEVSRQNKEGFSEGEHQDENDYGGDLDEEFAEGARYKK